jgi:hypothetical protein
MSLLYLSLLVNILVAGFWGTVLGLKLLPKIASIYGADGSGIRILASMYLAIATVSFVALFWPAHTLAIISILFPFQILYKLLTLPLVGTMRHPVVLSNIVIAILLSFTWYQYIYN